MNVNWGKSLNVIGWWQVAEDYGDEERERLQEELSTVKRRFSHNKVKRKWVSDIYLIGENWYWFAVECGIRGPHHPLYGKHSQSLVRTGLVWFLLIWLGWNWLAVELWESQTALSQNWALPYFLPHCSNQTKKMLQMTDWLDSASNSMLAGWSRLYVGVVGCCMCSALMQQPTTPICTCLHPLPLCAPCAMRGKMQTIGYRYTTCVPHVHIRARWKWAE